MPTTISSILRRSFVLGVQISILVACQSTTRVKMVEFEKDSYINTLREKLMWGKDKRTEQ